MVQVLRLSLGRHAEQLMPKSPCRADERFPKGCARHNKDTEDRVL